MCIRDSSYIAGIWFRLGRPGDNKHGILKEIHVHIAVYSRYPSPVRVLETEMCIRDRVYTRTVGEGFPILLLHGGPGANHICFEIFEKYIDLKKFSLIYYDQLGSSHSDKITDESLLTFTRFVDEVEQVRAALGLERFILLGHSWGGMLCIDYALKYEKEGHLAGLVISNMVDSGKHYLEYLDHVRKINLTPEEYDYMTEIEAAGKESDAHYQELVLSLIHI